MRILFSLILFLCGLNTCLASDDVIYTSAPAWVKTIPLNQDKSPDRGHVQILLNDFQVKKTTNGYENYNEVAYKILSPEGLTAFSNVIFSWNPDTQSLSINKLNIIRGDKVINILEKQKFTIIRREKNLENSIIDGNLTATIQPDSLQIGDIVNFANTYTEIDPVLKGHYGYWVSRASPLVTKRTHIRFVWPNTPTLRWRTTEGLPQPKYEKSDSGQELVMDILDLPATSLPNDAPARYLRPKQLDVTEFSGWSEISSLMSPYYQEASKLTPGSELTKTIDKIAAQSKDPVFRAQEALKIVQTSIRYLYSGLNFGGYLPAAAERTWVSKNGDCKAKTVLLLTILHALGVKAEPVLVSLNGADGLDQRLPTINSFDHVVVKSIIAGKVYWLDGTRTGDRYLSQLETPGFDWVLPVKPSGANLTRVIRAPLEKPIAKTEMTIDARAGLFAPAHISLTHELSGDQAYANWIAWQTVPQEDLESKLKQYWANEYDWLTPLKVSLNYDSEIRRLEFTLYAYNKINIDKKSKIWELDIPNSRLSFEAEFERSDEFDANIPWNIFYPEYSAVKTIIKLPEGRNYFKITGDDIKSNVFGREFYRQVTRKNNDIFMEAYTRSTESEMPASVTEQSEKELTQIWNNTSSVEISNRYVYTEGDANEAANSTPQTAKEYHLASQILADYDVNKSIYYSTKSIELSQDNPSYYWMRGNSYMKIFNLDKARHDFIKASELDDDAFYHRELARIFTIEGELNSALEIYNNILKKNPSDVDILLFRASCHFSLGNYDEALSDLDFAHRLEPGNFLILHNKYIYLLLLGRNEDIIKDLNNLISKYQDNQDYIIFKIQYLKIIGKNEEALNAVNALISSNELPSFYTLRANIREKSDRINAYNDLDIALSKNPDFESAIFLKAKFFAEDNKKTEALSLLSSYISQNKEFSHALLIRAEIFFQLNMIEASVNDLNSILNKNDIDKYTVLENLCATKVKRNYKIDTALNDCNSALQRNAFSPKILELRGLFNLQTNNIDDAVKDFNYALRQAPALPIALYGRGITWMAKGDQSAADKDFASARLIDPEIAEEFARYGLPQTATPLAATSTTD